MALYERACESCRRRGTNVNVENQGGLNTPCTSPTLRTHLKGANDKEEEEHVPALDGDVVCGKR